jgi:17beta-estradiol 17-dehydrogenase / very-long-chain 3-oxoacyl-CoA reductase
MKESELFKLVTVNCLSQLIVTRKILPLMLKRNQKCAVVNVSSFSAYGVPYLSVYAATKAFNDTFSKSLSKEYLGRVDCLSLRPLYVESQMTKGLKNAISGRDFVEHGLSFLGRT